MSIIEGYLALLIPPIIFRCTISVRVLLGQLDVLSLTRDRICVGEGRFVRRHRCLDSELLGLSISSWMAWDC